MQKRSHLPFWFKLLVGCVLSFLMGFITIGVYDRTFGAADFVISILAILAIVVAWISLREVVKARYDTFLPIIIAPEDFMFTTGTNIADAGIRLKNYGHGIAIDVTASLTGIDGVYSQKIVEVSEKLDKYTWRFGLSNTKFFTKSIDGAKLIIVYNDIFGRPIKTTYKVTQKSLGNDTFQPHIDWQSLKIELP